MSAEPSVGELKQRLDQHSAERFEVGTRLGVVERQLREVADFVGKIDGRLAEIEDRSASRDKRLGEIEGMVRGLVVNAADDRVWLRSWIERRELADAQAAADWRSLAVKVLGAVGLAVAGGLAGWFGATGGGP